MKKLFIIFMTVLLVLLGAVPAFAEEVTGSEPLPEQEAETVSDQEFKAASDFLRSVFPEKYAAVEKYYNELVEYTGKTGVMTKFSDTLAKYSDQFCAILFAIGFVIAVVFFCVYTKRHGTADRNARKNVIRATAALDASNERAEVRMQDMANSYYATLQSYCQQVRSDNEAVLKAAVDEMQLHNETVKQISEDNTQLARQNKAACMALYGCLVTLMEEMDIRNDVKIRIREQFNEAERVVLGNENQESVEDADTEG